jgi:hypothetical protein
MNGYQQPYDDVLSWDGGYYTPGENYIVLKPGIYNFTVQKVERARNEGNQQYHIPPCPQAVVVLSIMYEGQQVEIKDRINLLKKNMGRIGRLFESVGSPKNEHGDVQVNWNLLPGCSGKCEVSNTTGNNGAVFNNVKRYLPFDQQQQPAQTPQRNGWTAGGGF